MSPGDEQGYGDTGQTRTRLPGGDPYGGAPRRAGRSSSRSLITVVGVVVLLIAAIAFANRGDGSATSDSPAKNANRPETSSTAASGTRPVESKSGGIASGFAHSGQGAQSAAANYAVVLVSADILKPVWRGEVVRQVFIADQQAALADKFDKAYNKQFLNSIGLDEEGNAPAGHTYVSRTAPLGTKLTDYTGSAATVEVWCTGVFGTAGDDSTNPVTSDWFTMAFQLRWSDGDWKVYSFSQKDGPAPVPGDDKASSADQMAKAVEEYGGFTYAR
ncbi:hypothetical protein QQY24_17115 [Streptomyces sp. TG1A-8]|uniref:hypothetical protein n=1 Tax=Streptomyces sp. TG1A-8 TaxID=3051385 RepID=UPI00265B7D32|nr:hypothetical protein [Streptomyces sp. TG1A-8]MDO0927047.1 hypothetical protein [Streptomyces sp. TG1A-8]